MKKRVFRGFSISTCPFFMEADPIFCLLARRSNCSVTHSRIKKSGLKHFHFFLFSCFQIHFTFKDGHFFFILFVCLKLVVNSGTVPISLFRPSLILVPASMDTGTKICINSISCFLDYLNLCKFISSSNFCNHFSLKFFSREFLLFSFSLQKYFKFFN